MTSKTTASAPAAGRATVANSTRLGPSLTAPVAGSVVLLTALALLAIAWMPAVASAHGPTAPNASSYVARVSKTPRGLDAKVVDGDLRMWLKAPASETVVVLDYRGAPYLRFSASGVSVNHRSEMYYLNFMPSLVPPRHLSATAKPRWEQVTSAHEYSWHDGRLHALASVSLPAGASYVGKWSIALIVNGHRETISGGVWHSPAPSIVWFWPIFVLLACLLAGWRLRRRDLDAAIARALAVAALLALGTGAVARQLHGRPIVSAGQIAVLAVICAFLLLALRHVLRRRPGYFYFFVISMCTLMGDFELIPTLLHGYVLMALPAFLVRSAAVVCAGCGIALLLVTIRMANEPERAHAQPTAAPG